MNRAKILLADDHVIVLDGLRRILEHEYEIVGSVQNGRELLPAARRLHPDVIIIDISMPLMNGLEAARRLKQAKLGAKIIFLTMHADVDFAVEAFRVGAAGYVLKHDAEEELAKAIRAVLDGEIYVTPRIEKKVLHMLGNGASGLDQISWKLTRREREVLQLVAEGRRMAEVAGILDVSTRTVEFHKYNLMSKLQLDTTAELTKYAIRHGVISP